MKIILDTDLKQTFCPKEFFEYIRKINDAAELTGGTSKLTPEAYLDKLIKECTNEIINKTELNSTTRKKRTSKKNKIAEIVAR